MSADPVFNRIAVIGAGLIGGSIARASVASNAAGGVRVWDIDAQVRARAAEIGLGDVCDDPAEAVRDCDLVVLCAPSGAMAAAAAAVAPGLKPGAIITDVGSVKAAVAAAVGPVLPDGVHFIPGHPIAGTEQSGPDSGFASLFEGRWCILCPQDNADPDAVARLSAFWTRLGARVDTMDAARHDLVLAMTSHLPHLIAFTIVATAEDVETLTESEVVKYSAGGFRDFTRIAASDPTMWRDVFLLNREAVLDLLGRFSEDLTALRRAIRWGDGDTLFATFERARRMRKGVIEAGQDIAAPDFGRSRPPG
jgi:cyclohexadieny/prephenate dehydrogenase